jgi:hypothetical protein
MFMVTLVEVTFMVTLYEVTFMMTLGEVMFMVTRCYHARRYHVSTDTRCVVVFVE